MVNKNDKAKVVDFPQIQPVSEVGVVDYITSLYEKLGWNRKSGVNPSKVVLNRQHWSEICQECVAISQLCGFVWMDSGPSSSEDVPYGKAVIRKGAFC